MITMLFILILIILFLWCLYNMFQPRIEYIRGSQIILWYTNVHGVRTYKLWKIKNTLQKI